MLSLLSSRRFGHKPKLSDVTYPLSYKEKKSILSFLNNSTTLFHSIEKGVLYHSSLGGLNLSLYSRSESIGKNVSFPYYLLVDENERFSFESLVELCILLRLYEINGNRSLLFYMYLLYLDDELDRKKTVSL